MTITVTIKVVKIMVLVMAVISVVVMISKKSSRQEQSNIKLIETYHPELDSHNRCRSLKSYLFSLFSVVNSRPIVRFLSTAVS